MTDRRSPDDELAAIEGADPAALGISGPPESAPAGATVDDAEERLPGPPHDGPGRAVKPWASSLAAESGQAGVANEPPGDDEAT
jgi:hypothetical protein